MRGEVKTFNVTLAGSGTKHTPFLFAFNQNKLLRGYSRGYQE